MLLAVLVAFVATIEGLGLLAGVDAYFYDHFFRLRGSRQTSDRVVVVAIDADSLAAFGRWPLPRHRYAALLDRLEHAAVVSFDLLLTEPSADDQQLAAAIGRHGSVILAGHLEQGGGLVEPSPLFSPRGIAHVHVEPGVDHVVRELFHSIYRKGVLIPSLSSAVYEADRGRPIPRAAFSGDRDGLVQQDLHRINYYGPAGAFTTVSLVDVLEGRHSPDFFRDRLVLVGVTAPGIVDQVATPFSQLRTRMPGVELHATVLNNLLDAGALRDVAQWFETTSLLVFSLLLARLFLAMREQQALLAWCASLILLPSASLALFVAGRWLPPAAFLVSGSAMFAAVYLRRLNTAVRRLDREYAAMVTLLGRGIGGEAGEVRENGGLLSLLSERGINEKIRRQSIMTARLVAMHKKLEALLKTERETLDNQIRFVEMLSHEYRTPLAIIRANLDILELRDTEAPRPFTAYYDKMKRAVSRLTEIMDISFSAERMDGSDNRMQQRRLELTGFVRLLFEESCALWTERRLYLELPEKGEVVIFADAALFKTVLLNLVDNAIKHSPPDEAVSIVLQVGTEAAAISVCNRRPCIPAEELERVFDKYYRGRSSANIQGAGLGLYLVRKIVEQQGGTVQLSSSAEAGTRATVTMPLLRTDGEATAPGRHTSS